MKSELNEYFIAITRYLNNLTYVRHNVRPIDCRKYDTKAIWYDKN